MSQNTKRPPNAFFLYKRENHKRIKEEFKCINSRDVSVKAAELWRKETPEIRQEFEQRSKELYHEFKQKYPKHQWKAGKNKTAESEQVQVSPLPSPFIPFQYSHTPQMEFTSPRPVNFSPASSYMSSPAGSLTFSPNMEFIQNRMEDFRIDIRPQSLVDPAQFRRDFCINGDLDEFGESEALPPLEKGFNAQLRKMDRF